MGLLNSNEMQMLNQFAVLSPDSRRQVESYLSYLVDQQCRHEIQTQLLGNPWLFKYVQRLYLFSETEETYCIEVMEQVRKIRNFCLKIYEHLFEKYVPLLKNRGVVDGALEGFCLGLNQVCEAARKGNKTRTRLEVIEMFETYRSLIQTLNLEQKRRTM